MRDAGRITLRTIILLSTFLLFGRLAVADQCGVIGRVSNGTLLDLTLSGMVTIDTDTGDITNGGGTLVSGGAAGVSVFAQPAGPWPLPAPELRVYDFRNLTIEAGASVQVVGTRGLALLVSEILTVDGLLDASGNAGSAGAANAPGAGGGGVAG